MMPEAKQFWVTDRKTGSRRVMRSAEIRVLAALYALGVKQGNQQGWWYMVRDIAATARTSETAVAGAVIRFKLEGWIEATKIPRRGRAGRPKEMYRITDKGEEVAKWAWEKVGKPPVIKPQLPVTEIHTPVPEKETVAETATPARSVAIPLPFTTLGVSTPPRLPHPDYKWGPSLSKVLAHEKEASLKRKRDMFKRRLIQLTDMHRMTPWYYILTRATIRARIRALMLAIQTLDQIHSDLITGKAKPGDVIPHQGRPV